MNWHSSVARTRSGPPVAVFLTVGLLGAYSLLALLHLATLSSLPSEVSEGHIRSTVMRALGGALMAAGVARRASWGRWLTFALGGLWAAFSALALIQYAGGSLVAPTRMIYLGPVGVVALLLLGSAIGLLLLPQSRVWFGRAFR